MATPLGHALAGMAAGSLLRSHHSGHARWLAFVALAAIAPDFDFLPGILMGDVNRFHHGASHSVGAALLFGGACALGAWAVAARPLAIGGAGAILYASHLLLDFFTVDTRLPYGQPLLWPATMEHFAMSKPFLLGIRHGSADGSVIAFLRDAFSGHNFTALAREIVLLVPVVFVTWIAGRRRGRRAGRGQQAVPVGIAASGGKASPASGTGTRRLPG